MIKTPKPLLIDLYQIVPYASITVCMYVILAPRYTSVYTPVCWFAGIPRHHLGPLKTVIRAFSGPAGPKNGFFGHILLRYGQTVGRTENTWTPTESFCKADKSSSL